MDKATLRGEWRGVPQKNNESTRPALLEMDGNATNRNLPDPPFYDHKRRVHIAVPEIHK
jgi:hypothetical protein